MQAECKLAAGKQAGYKPVQVDCKQAGYMQADCMQADCMQADCMQAGCKLVGSSLALSKSPVERKSSSLAG